MNENELWWWFFLCLVCTCRRRRPTNHHTKNKKQNLEKRDRWPLKIYLASPDHLVVWLCRRRRSERERKKAGHVLSSETLWYVCCISDKRKKNRNKLVELPLGQSPPKTQGTNSKNSTSLFRNTVITYQAKKKSQWFLESTTEIYSDWMNYKQKNWTNFFCCHRHTSIYHTFQFLERKNLENFSIMTWFIRWIMII